MKFTQEFGKWLDLMPNSQSSTLCQVLSSIITDLAQLVDQSATRSGLWMFQHALQLLPEGINGLKMFRRRSQRETERDEREGSCSARATSGSFIAKPCLHLGVLVLQVPGSQPVLFSSQFYVPCPLRFSLCKPGWGTMQISQPFFLLSFQRTSPKGHFA